MYETFVETPQGIFLNQLRRYAKGSTLAPAQALVPLVTAAAPGAGLFTQSTPVTIEGPQDCVTEVYSYMAEQLATDAADVQARLSCTVYDLAWRRFLMNRDCLVNHVFGNNLQPYFLKETTFLENQQTMVFQFRNNSVAGASNLRFALEAMKLQKTALDFKDVRSEVDRERVRKTFFYPYWMTSDLAVTVAPGASFDVFFTNTNDLYLFLFYLMFTAIPAGGAVGDLQEFFTFQILDPKTSRPLQNTPVAANCGMGTARFPYRFPTPLLVEPRTQITIRITSLLTAANLEVFLTFGGVAQFTGEGLWSAPGIGRDALGPVIAETGPE
jgi:hypothetical protein